MGPQIIIREQVNFIKVELRIATTYCRLAQECDEEHLPKHLENARRAYENAIRFLMRAQLDDRDFSEITANAERLKLSIEAVEKRQTSKR